jgi:hypothetical protein
LSLCFCLFFSVVVDCCLFFSFLAALLFHYENVLNVRSTTKTNTELLIIIFYFYTMLNGFHHYWIATKLSAAHYISNNKELVSLYYSSYCYIILIYTNMWNILFIWFMSGLPEKKGTRERY